MTYKLPEPDGHIECGVDENRAPALYPAWFEDKMQAAYAAGLAEGRKELLNIADVKRFNREMFRDDTEWADWVSGKLCWQRGQP